jgi:hypothetical protein
VGSAFVRVVEAGEDGAPMADLVVVPYWERAAADEVVRNALESAVDCLQRRYGRPVAEIVFDRLIVEVENPRETVELVERAVSKRP